MAKQKTVLMRVDPKFKKMIDESMFNRFRNKLITRKEYTSAEATRLLTRMPEIRLGFNKLAKLPKKEDIKWDLP